MRKLFFEVSVLNLGLNKLIVLEKGYPRTDWDNVNVKTWLFRRRITSLVQQNLAWNEINWGYFSHMAFGQCGTFFTGQSGMFHFTRKETKWRQFWKVLFLKCCKPNIRDMFNAEKSQSKLNMVYKFHRKTTYRSWTNENMCSAVKKHCTYFQVKFYLILF